MCIRDRTFLCPGEEAVQAFPTFLVYEKMVRGAGGRMISVPLSGFKIDLKAISQAITPDTKIVFINNPNNPTGSILSRDEMRLFLRGIPRDVIVVLDLDKIEVNVILMPLYLKGKYLKLGRYISQMIWIRRNGTKKYKLSIEEECRKLLDLINGLDIKIHASGREDVDARMLGSGRPLIIEIRNPKNRNVGLSKIHEVFMENPWIRVVIEEKASPSAVTKLKQSNPCKAYRVVAFSEEKVNEVELHNFRKFFTNRTIKQLTPKRVLSRKNEVLRIKKVYEVDAKILHPNLIEFIIWCDSGLYVKELVHGDDGRTTPSFAEFLHKNLTVLFLDVLKIGSIKLP